MHLYRHLLVPALLIICTTIARADVIDLTPSASDALANLGTKFVIGCAFLALGMVGAAAALREPLAEKLLLLMRPNKPAQTDGDKASN